MTLSGLTDSVRQCLTARIMNREHSVWLWFAIHGNSQTSSPAFRLELLWGQLGFPGAHYRDPIVDECIEKPNGCDHLDGSGA